MRTTARKINGENSIQIVCDFDGQGLAGMPYMFCHDLLEPFAISQVTEVLNKSLQNPLVDNHLC